ncbi:Acg family FMN-binding oxidoreductase [Streptomyces sp. NPDC058256]|uniref:Acg family FMN-binding oxidoreductase n=1 Tax=Streptomyces sp. NPDC058256 TaxID=3346408 RepID=UPI0036EB2FD0
MYTTHPRADHATSHLVCAAITAPSLHNSQPWLFTGRDTGLDLYADPTRRLPRTDPAGREMAISCGAALFNVRLAMRHLGFLPVVRPFPDPWNPAFLARVAWGPYAGPSADEELMHHAMRQRHTHRGPFRTAPLPQLLIDELREHARAECAELYTLGSHAEVNRLAELVRDGEQAGRTDPGRVAELTHWTRPSRSSRLDGVPFDDCPYHPDCTSLAGRDFLGLTRTMPTPPAVWPARTGLVALLSTSRDTRGDWLRAGQALQRVLLYAAAHRVGAAFHTQPLEVPHLRAQVRTTIVAGQFPQMILRLGFVGRGRQTPRRPAAEVLSAD